MNADTDFVEVLARSFPELSWREVELFARYYRFVLKWNDRLHLTTITTPDAFVLRHLGEAIFIGNRILPGIDELWDIGSGAGIPGIPIAVLRPEMEVRLVEANRRKALFLEEVATELQLRRVKVINARVEAIAGFSGHACLAARAVEKMEEVVRGIVSQGAEAAQILILGGVQLEGVMGATGWLFEKYRLPASTNRWLFELINAKTQWGKDAKE